LDYCLVQWLAGRVGHYAFDRSRADVLIGSPILAGQNATQKRGY
jgi:hypothetical protein